MRELTEGPMREYFRPNFWPNTPDILSETLQTGGLPAFRSRLVLAATLAANYGIYGPAFELGENRPANPGSEEYLNSEKYEIRQWDLRFAHQPQAAHRHPQPGAARSPGVAKQSQPSLSRDGQRFSHLLFQTHGGWGETRFWRSSIWIPSTCRQDGRTSISDILGLSGSGEPFEVRDLLGGSHLPLARGQKLCRAAAGGRLRAPL